MKIGRWKHAVIVVAAVMLCVAMGTESGAVQASSEADLQELDSIQVAFVGDMILDKSVGNQIGRHGVDYPFLKTADFLKQADLTIGNLETPVSTRGRPEKKGIYLSCETRVVEGARERRLRRRQSGK
nr:CapA family protein [Brevibacillus formosus]